MDESRRIAKRTTKKHNCVIKIIHAVPLVINHVLSPNASRASSETQSAFLFHTCAEPTLVSMRQTNVVTLLNGITQFDATTGVVNGDCSAL